MRQTGWPSQQWTSSVGLSHHLAFYEGQNSGAPDNNSFSSLSVPQLTEVLPHAWDVTSDTIAAWVAGTIHLDILLLKSITGIFIKRIHQEQVTGLVETDIIDPCFIPFVIRNAVKTTIVNGSKPDRVEKYLKEDLVPRTEIGTTF